MEKNIESYTMPSKQFAKLVLNNKILNANDKLYPASIKNWRKIFAGTDESFESNGKKFRRNSLIEIEIVDYNKTAQEKVKGSLRYNLDVRDVSRIRDEIYRSKSNREKEASLFSRVKTHSYCIRNDGKGEVIIFEMKKEPKMSSGDESRYPYRIRIQKGWAILKAQGVGYEGGTFQSEKYYDVRLSYDDIIDFFDQILDGIEIFKFTEGCRLRKLGLQKEEEMRLEYENTKKEEMKILNQAMNK